MSTPGWYDDGRGAQRWWDGQQWTDHTAPSAAQAQLVDQSTGIQRHRLSEAIATMVRNGWRVEAQGDDFAVMVGGNRPNHILHLLLTVFTVGLWAIVWIIVAMASGEKRRTVRVDPHGNVTFY